MARMAVTSYLEAAERTHGPEVADILWRRVQSGFILADSVRTTPRKLDEKAITPIGWDEGIPICEEEVDKHSTKPGMSLAECSGKLLTLFQRKAMATRGLHASAVAQIRGRPISVWLTPSVMDEEGEAFIKALANSWVWITPGKPADKSRLYREFSWGGKMFGVS